MPRFSAISPNARVRIGRDRGAELQLTDITVSSLHAEVTADASGNITITDLDSTNGTTVNGRPIRRAVLRPGDSLKIGAAALRLDLLPAEEITHLECVVRRLHATNHDPLTGLLRRAYMDDELPLLSQRCERAGVPLTCAFIDIDRFKSINDRYGHQLGDEVLRAVSRILLICVRSSDPCVRYGGEEIILFLPGSDEATGVDVAERSRRAIAHHDWAHTAQGLHVTASFGVSERGLGEPFKDWLRRADLAMYNAKMNGRNLVVPASSVF